MSGRRHKGSILCPLRAEVLRRLQSDREWKRGIRADEAAVQMDITNERAQKVLHTLVEHGHIKRVIERVPGRGGLFARYFAPENAKEAQEAAFESLIAAREHARKAKVHGERARRMERRIQEMQSAAAPGCVEKETEPPKPKYIGEVVPCRAVAWSKPFEPAGFGELEIGSYLPGESWVTRAFGARA